MTTNSIGKIEKGTLQQITDSTLVIDGISVPLDEIAMIGFSSFGKITGAILKTTGSVIGITSVSGTVWFITSVLWLSLIFDPPLFLVNLPVVLLVPIIFGLGIGGLLIAYGIPAFCAYSMGWSIVNLLVFKNQYSVFDGWKFRIVNRIEI